jgi:hypothetical protein
MTCLNRRLIFCALRSTSLKDCKNRKKGAYPVTMFLQFLQCLSEALPWVPKINCKLRARAAFQLMQLIAVFAVALWGYSSGPGQTPPLGHCKNCKKPAPEAPPRMAACAVRLSG